MTFSVPEKGPEARHSTLRGIFVGTKRVFVIKNKLKSMCTWHRNNGVDRDVGMGVGMVCVCAER